MCGYDRPGATQCLLPFRQRGFKPIPRGLHLIQCRQHSVFCYHPARQLVFCKLQHLAQGLGRQAAQDRFRILRVNHV